MLCWLYRWPFDFSLFLLSPPSLSLCLSLTHINTHTHTHTHSKRNLLLPAQQKSLVNQTSNSWRNNFDLFVWIDLNFFFFLNLINAALFILTGRSLWLPTEEWDHTY